MNKEIDLSKYQIRTDLAIDEIENKVELKGVKSKNYLDENIKVTEVILDKENALNKKKGKYITLEFDDITDSNNSDNVCIVLTKIHKKIFLI